ncbi:MAG TPA: glycosyltransferase family 2 protein [Mucilaginibacter sp.]
MVPISIIIITKNEADIISKCIAMARRITDDIVIIDSGSVDDTLEIAIEFGCRVYRETWNGYGANKNKGIDAAKYDWILSIDADEIPDEELICSLHQQEFDNPAVVYDIKFRSYFGTKPIRFGSWGRDHHIRLFNRKLVKWSETVVHETLTMPDNIEKTKLAGSMHHFSVKDLFEYERKCAYYARLSAQKYFQNGKKVNAVKLYVSPVFGFLKNYIVFLGFLDGREGWHIAKTTFKNTHRKYFYLSEITRSPDNKNPVDTGVVVEYDYFS